MVSALTVLLGCWLAGQRGAQGERPRPKPSISTSPEGVIPVGGHVTIRCRAEGQDLRFLLYKDGDGKYLNYTDPAGPEAEFSITSARREDSGNYTCCYSNRHGSASYSEFSNPVQVIVAEGLNSPTSPDQTILLIAGVSVAALVLLLLLAAFMWFTRTRARKGEAPRPSSAGSLGASTQQDPVYASVDEEKQPQRPPQEPEPDAKGLTYAELNHQAPQAKRGAPSPAPEPVLYAAVSRSWGAPP